MNVTNDSVITLNCLATEGIKHVWTLFCTAFMVISVHGALLVCVGLVSVTMPNFLFISNACEQTT